ncbi:MAG: carbohydrate porin [Verrucomicrobiota bacterium]
MYQYTDYAGKFGTQNWISAGVRPVIQLNKFFRLAFEGGVDWVSESGLSPAGNVMKLSFARTGAGGSILQPSGPENLRHLRALERRSGGLRRRP